jgi:hypothetical protein
VPEKQVLDAMNKLVQDKRLLTYSGPLDPPEKPDNLIWGTEAMFHNLQPDHNLVTPAGASKKGWSGERIRRFELNDGGKLMSLLPRIGGLYARGARSEVKSLQLIDLQVAGGAALQLTIEDATPESMKRLGELFEVLSTVVELGPQSQVELEIEDPDDNCPFLQELKK